MSGICLHFRWTDEGNRDFGRTRGSATKGKSDFLFFGHAIVSRTQVCDCGSGGEAECDLCLRHTRSAKIHAEEKSRSRFPPILRFYSLMFLLHKKNTNQIPIPASSQPLLSLFSRLSRNALLLQVEVSGGASCITSFSSFSGPRKEIEKSDRFPGRKRRVSHSLSFLCSRCQVVA